MACRDPSLEITLLTKSLRRPSLIALVPAAAIALITTSAGAQQVFDLELISPVAGGFNRAECLDNEGTVTFSWQAQRQTFETEAVFISKNQNCSSEDVVLREEQEYPPGISEQTYPGVADPIVTSRFLFSVVTQPQATDEEDEEEDTEDPTVAEVCGGAAGVEQTLYVCVRRTTFQIGWGERSNFFRAAVVVDSKPPPRPRNLSVEEREGGLVVDWGMPDSLQGTQSYVIYYRPEGADPEDEQAQAVNDPALRRANLRNLENGVTYVIQMIAVDGMGNQSERTAEVTGTPRDIEDFFERYRRMGGEETGGCSQTGTTGLLAVLGLLGVLAWRRRRSALWLGTLVLLAGAPALAQNGNNNDIRTPRDYRSPQRFTLDLRGGPYRPNIDSEPGLTGTPYADVFGTSSPWMWRAELDWDFLKTRWGRVGVGLSGGFWEALGRGFDLDTGERVNDTVLFNVAPYTAVLVYRADFLWTRWNIPFVPFARGGYGLVRWSTRTGQISEVGDARGAGWGHGFEVSAGLQFVLDFLDPGASLALDQELGVNYSAIFVEFGRNEWRGANGLRLDGNNIQVGLSFAF